MRNVFFGIIVVIGVPSFTLVSLLGLPISSAVAVPMSATAAMPVWVPTSAMCSSNFQQRQQVSANFDQAPSDFDQNSSNYTPLRKKTLEGIG